MSWASLISGIVSLFNKIAALIHDKRQQDLGAKEAVLEGKKEVENEITRVNEPITDAERVQELSSSSNRANRRKKTSV